MDNDNKIDTPETKALSAEVKTELKAKDFIPEQQVHKDVRTFLNNELESLYQQNKLQSYNLEKEYAETKKHHSPLAWIILGICFAVVLGTVIVMATVISNKERSIEVEMAVFDDLNLKDLLDSVSKVQNNYDDAVKQRSVLLNGKEVAIRNAEATREQDIFVVKSTKLTAREERERIAIIENEYNLALQNIQTEYDPKINVIETEIRDYENQLKEYNASKIQAAQEQERLLNSERRVQELERRKLTQQYESRIEELEKTIEDLRTANSSNVYKSVSSLSSKYQAEIDGLDPKIKDQKADKILDNTNSKENQSFNGAVLSENITDYTVTTGFEKYQEAYDDYVYLNKIIAALPQKNTIPSYVDATKKLVNSMGETFTETTLSLERDKSSLTSQVGNLKNKYNGLSSDYDELIEEYNDLIDEYNDKETEISTMKLNHKQELQNQEQKLTEQFIAEKTALTEEFAEEKTEMEKQHAAQTLEQRDYFEKCIGGIITSSKGMAAVISADSKENIRIYVLPELESKIAGMEIPAEIKAVKSVKGTIVQDDSRYYKFIPAVDKNGDLIDFDLSTITSGLLVKLTIKK